MDDRKFSHPLLDRLGDVARAELRVRAGDRTSRAVDRTPLPSDDERLFARYAAGELDAASLRELQARADRDPELARGLALFAPLTPDELRELGDRVHRALSDESARAMPAAGPRHAQAAGSRPRRRAALVGAGAAALGGAALYAAVRDEVAPSLLPSRRDDRTPLPAYAVEARGGLASHRGAEPPPEQALVPQRLPPGGRLQVALRPAADVGSRVAVAAFLVPLSAGDGGLVAAGPPQAVSPRIEVDDRSGAVRVTAIPREHFGARRGRFRLVLVLSRSEAGDRLPFPAQLVHDARPRGEDWVRAEVELELVDSPSAPVPQ